MTDMAGRIAGRLRTVGASDREWVLCQLTVDERRQVLAALSDRAACATNAAPAENDRKLHSAAAASAASSGTPATAEFVELQDAQPGQLVTFLADEPDWVVVLLLGFREWSWAEGFLQLLPPQKVVALRELSAVLDGKVRPTVKDALARALTERLRTQAEKHGNRSVFDLVLDRAEHASRRTAPFETGALA